MPPCHGAKSRVYGRGLAPWMRTDLCSRVMKFGRFAVAAVWFAACVDGADHDAPGTICQDAQQVQEDAMNEAIAKAPACKVDADCVAMPDRAECIDELVNIELCDRAVHRKVLELYNAKDVTARMCEVASESRFGCSVSASCVQHAGPVCRRGACVFP
jgi:hypothetical protein